MLRALYRGGFCDKPHRNNGMKDFGCKMSACGSQQEENDLKHLNAVPRSAKKKKKGVSLHVVMFLVQPALFMVALGCGAESQIYKEKREIMNQSHLSKHRKSAETQ